MMIQKFQVSYPYYNIWDLDSLMLERFPLSYENDAGYEEVKSLKFRIFWFAMLSLL